MNLQEDDLRQMMETLTQSIKVNEDLSTSDPKSSIRSARPPLAPSNSLYASAMKSISPVESARTHCVHLIEQQRYDNDLALWSPLCLPTDPPPWSSASTPFTLLTKEDVELAVSASGGEWTSSWYSSTPRGDPDGWEYSRGFSQKFHATLREERTVRRRFWARHVVFPSSSPSNSALRAAGITTAGAPHNDNGQRLNECDTMWSTVHNSVQRATPLDNEPFADVTSAVASTSRRESPFRIHIDPSPPEDNSFDPLPLDFCGADQSPHLALESAQSYSHPTLPKASPDPSPRSRVGGDYLTSYESQMGDGPAPRAPHVRGSRKLQRVLQSLEAAQPSPSASERHRGSRRDIKGPKDRRLDPKLGREKDDGPMRGSANNPSEASGREYNNVGCSAPPQAFG